MRIDRFRVLAAGMWEEIPPPLREGVEALSVEEEALPHPGLEGVFTLGECVTDEWPSGYGGPGDTRSHLVLYHGSFRVLAERESGFDWEGELRETILHELLHHREYAAGEAGLEAFDWAVEQNQRRYAEEPFDPTFYRAVPPGPEGSWRLESEIFVESEAAPGADEARFAWRGTEYSVPVPPEEEPLFVRAENLAEGRLWVVVRRKRPWWRRIFGIRPGAPRELSAPARPVAGGPPERSVAGADQPA